MENIPIPSLTVKREGRYIRVISYNSFNHSADKINHFVNDKKLENNLIRAKTSVREYARCNHWDYFVTLTISPEKLDRYDLKTYISSLGKFLNNYSYRKCEKGKKVKYILIPEKHKDGAYHLHGLMANINPNDLTINKYGYLDWKSYSDKFGYISLSPIKNLDAVSLYILKYITKDFSFVDKGDRLYYCSKGLNKAEVLYSGAGFLACDPDYIGQYGTSFKEFLFTENWEDKVII